MNRIEAYALLSDLIFKGFLTAEMRVGNQNLIFKTVTEKEFDLIKMYAGSKKDKGYISRFNTYFLVYSLFILGHKNVLKDRDENFSEYYEFFSNIPDALYKKVISGLNDMRVEAYNVFSYLEGFSYTNKSRRIWKILGGSFPNISEYTGIPGTSGMGLNLHQESWMGINRSLDSEERYNQNFSLALLVASASNPKGVQRVRSQHDSNVKNMEDRRLRLADVGYEEKEGWKPEGWAAPVDTVEGIVAELERQVHGVKDKHDLFMEEYMRKMKERAQEKAREAEERIRAAAEKDLPALSGGQRILTAKETEELMSRGKPTTVSVRSESAASPEDKQRFHKKIGTKVLTGRR